MAPAENRMAGYRLYITDAPAQSALATKLYNALMAMDAEFCVNKVNGSIELHYSSGQLAKIHLKKVV